MYPNTENTPPVQPDYNPNPNPNPNTPLSEYPLAAQQPGHQQNTQQPGYSQMPPQPGYSQMPPQQPEYYPPQQTSCYNYQQEPAGGMYSPGICADQPPPRDPVYTSIAVNSRKKYRPAAGSFLRSLCLVLACALLSSAASFLVIEMRFRNLDLNPAPNQVILGNDGRSQGQGNDNYDNFYPAPLIDHPDGGITAQDIYDMALTQVVGISVTAPESSWGFGSQSSASSVTGSGFIISKDGYILTNYHVIEMAHSMSIPIDVILHDGSSHTASVVGFEKNSDVAVLKIEATGLNPAYIGVSSDLRVGQTVYAVGNPFGDLVYTMTDGIVSALDRVVSVDGKTISTFQFSAAVNSGNSGGPVYNTAGEVIGIVTAKVIRGNVEGIGFAIPINDAIDIATALIEHGYISGRPLLGIVVQPVSSANAEYFGWVVGAYVRSVNPDSAADKAGIKVGDIITAIDEEEVNSPDTLKFALRRYKAGDTASITVWRNGDSIDMSITFDEDMNAGRPDITPIPEPDSPDPFSNLP